MYIPKPRKLSSGKWFIQLRLGKRSLSITDPDKKTCIRRATAAKAQYKAELLQLPKSEKKTCRTLTEAIDYYLESKSNVLSPATLRSYRIIQKNRFQNIMQRRVSEIDPKEWQRIVNEEAQKCSPKTLKNAFAFLCSVVRMETGERVPPVQLPQLIKSERAYLKPDEIKKFVETIKADREFAVPALLALSSLRISEISALNWENIEEEPQFIHVSGAVVFNEYNSYERKKQNKNYSSNREVPILIPELLETIQRDRKPSGPVLRDQNSLRKAVHAACSRAGVTDVSVHGLRHSFASLAYHLGVPERVTMEIGGWSDHGTMHRIYTHIAKADIQWYGEKMRNFYEK